MKTVLTIFGYRITLQISIINTRLTTRQLAVIRQRKFQAKRRKLDKCKVCKEKAYGFSKCVECRKKEVKYKAQLKAIKK